MVLAEQIATLVLEAFDSVKELEGRQMVKRHRAGGPAAYDDDFWTSRGLPNLHIVLQCCALAGITLQNCAMLSDGTLHKANGRLATS